MLEEFLSEWMQVFVIGAPVLCLGVLAVYAFGKVLMGPFGRAPSEEPVTTADDEEPRRKGKNT